MSQDKTRASLSYILPMDVLRRQPSCNGCCPRRRQEDSKLCMIEEGDEELGEGRAVIEAVLKLRGVVVGLSLPPVTSKEM